MSPVRIAAHVHSAWSYDAEWPLENVARSLSRLGYGVALMAEHDRGFDHVRWAEYQHACAEASTSDMLLVPGIEYEDADNVVHIPVWGSSVSFLGAGRPTLEVLEAAREQEAATLFAHPVRRRAIERFRADWGPLLSGVELWNRKSDGVAPSRSGRQLVESHGLAPFVSLDFHTSRQLFPLAMIATLAEPPTVGAIVDRIREGACVPEFLGIPALRFTRGAEGASIAALEDLRRTLRGPLRRLAGRSVDRSDAQEPASGRRLFSGAGHRSTYVRPHR